MLTLLADAGQHGLTPFSILVLRSLLVPLLLYNLIWSFQGIFHFWKTHVFPVSIYKAMIFLFTAGVVVRQINFFVGYPTEDFSVGALIAVCFTALASITAAVTHRLNLATRLKTYYWLMMHENMDVAVRAAELSRFDREYMEGVMDNAETTIAVSMAQKAMSK